MWKERLWQVFLVAILGLTLTMCSRSSSNNSTSSSNTANAEPSAISHTMFCTNIATVGGVVRYYYCDASDDTTLTSVTRSGTTYPDSITHDEAFAAGWKLVGPGCGTGNSGVLCTLFHK